VSTRLLLEGADVEELLARVHTEHGPEARIVKAERVRSGGVGGFFARERYEVTVEVPEVPEVPEAPDDPGEARDAVAASPGSVEDLLDAADARERADQPVVRAWSPPAADAPAVVTMPRRPLSTDGHDFAEVLSALTATAQRERRPAPTAASPTAAQPSTGPGIAELSRLGVPDELLVHLGPGEVVRQMHRILRRLPVPPRSSLPHGGVVAVVGQRRHAARCAAALAEQLRTDPAAVLYACAPDATVPARRRVAGVGDARRRAAAARAKELTVVVVVDAEVEPADQAWAHDVLEALAPEQIWAVVDAGRKTEDTRRHLRAVAGQTGVDALAVHGTAGTSDPASVLALGSPVGLLDGAPATPAAWTALLLDRLEEAR
jgi:hypothetical protein